MKASELRIGNYVGILDPGITKRCDALDIHDIYQGDTTYKPIPLTEEWLLKFGIKNRKIWVFEIFGNNERGFHISSEGGEWLFIQYVHQLQNLYFELTGKELEYDQN